MRHDLLPRSWPLRGLKAISAYMHTAPERLLAWAKRKDFPMQQDVQHGLDTGAVPEVLFGRNEVAVIHFHRSLLSMLDAAGEGTP